VSGPSWAANARERLVGIRAAAHEHGVDVVVAEGDFRMESGAAAMSRWLESGSPPSAVIGVSDEVAMGVLGVLATRSRGGPQIAVGGFDDTDLAGSDVISLTSVAQHIEEMGQKGVRLLVDQLAYRTHPPAHDILQPDLHVRRTSLISSPTSSSRSLSGPAAG
jgi:LacI family transcriptional regulator